MKPPPLDKPNNLPSNDRRSKEPPLRIVHFMLWSTVSAAVLSVMLQLRAEQIEQMLGREWLVYGLYALQAMVSGAGVSGLLLGAYRRLRGRRFPVNPGQWLLVANGLLTLWGLSYWAVVNWLDGPGLGAFGSRINTEAVKELLFALNFAVIASVYTLGWLFTPDPSAWRSLFQSLILMHAIAAFVYLFDSAYYHPRRSLYVQGGLAALTGLGLIICVRTGDRTNGPYGWLHWTGVGGTLLDALAMILWCGLYLQLFS